jgi:hypothetical protein
MRLIQQTYTPRKLKKIAEVCGVSVDELTAIGA